eukprot:12872992-Ditylum_brightwellii.AAC.1
MHLHRHFDQVSKGFPHHDIHGCCCCCLVGGTLEIGLFEAILIDQHEISQDAVDTFSNVDLQDMLPVRLSMHGDFEVMIKDFELLGGLKEAAWELLLIILVALMELKQGDG